MKKTLILFSLCLASVTAMHAQRVMNDGFDRLEVHYQTPTLGVKSQPFADGKADELNLAGYLSGGEVGSPALPVRTDVIVIPFCTDVVVEVSNAVYDTLDLSATLFMPLQPSRFKSDTSRMVPVINADRYATDAFWGMPLASVEVIGVARDRRLANLTFSPVQVNPVTGQVIVCKSADITVRYNGSDEEATREHFRRYYTPAFSVGTTLNELVNTKDVARVSPVRMVIFAPNTLYSGSLQRFANWKRSQGMIVDLVNVTDAQLSSSEAIAEYLQNLYNNATAEAPAPTYILLVGDLGQIRAFNSKIDDSWVDNSHVSDLYYVTWTNNDNIPDAYQGRFSVTDTNTLAHIVNKTILYESYAFEDDSYLGRAALISGEDNGTHQTSGWSADNAWIYCDPTMDYISKTYINHENGFDTVHYYKNNVDFAPDGVFVTGYCSDATSARVLRDLYSEGLGWINYSAHGDWDRWHKPNFTTTHVSSMNNNGKPSFMIGNCCLTNKFDKSVCFGESLLRRKNNAGAVAYIGGTNSTLWSEDFYWSVGVRTNINNTMNTSHQAFRLGMYDRLFHTHDEEYSKYAITAGAMVVAGNMSVNSSSSSYKLYYWEIYELMGDPSLLPWLGRASDLTPTVELEDNTMRVKAAPYAYVAVVDSADMQVRAAAFANARGVVDFDFGRSAGLDHSFLSITAQGYKPFQYGFNDEHVGIDNVSTHQQISVYPNPATDYVAVEGLPQGGRIEIYDAAGRLQLSTTETRFSVVSLAAGLYLMRLSGENGVVVKKLVVNK